MADKGKIPSPKSQREISLSQHQPYDVERGNPNNTSTFNRGNQVSFRDDNTKPFTLGFKELDEAILYYLENIIKPTVQQNGVVQKVPVIYGSPERWKQIQKDGYYRDKKGKIMLPLITFKRNSIERNKSLSRKLDANSTNNVQIFTKKYSSKDAYSNFNLLNNRIPIDQQYAVVMPDWVNVQYEFIISTYYIEQLNKVIEAINYASDSYWGDPERFKFKATIDTFSTPIELQQGKERTVKSNFNLKLYGYIVPDTIQKELEALKKFNSKTKIIFNMEAVTDISEVCPPLESPPQIQSNSSPSSFEE